MRTVIRAIGGAHLYGTATPQSDRDELAVHVASARDILLQRIKGVVVHSAGPQNRKNEAGDLDVESYEIATWLKMLGDGETRVYDVLFAPNHAVLERDDVLWAQIRPVALAQMNSRVKGFVRYCRRQAAKYGVKGSRIAAVKSALALLGQHHQELRLTEIESDLTAWASGTEHASVETPDGSTIQNLIVCDRACPLTNRVRHAVEIYERIEREYGARARAAEKNEGIDWKAMSHAVRVGTQVEELLTAGTITFPRPDADLLLAIKLGQMPYRDIADRLEALVDHMECLATNTALPQQPDRETADALVVDLHRLAVLQDKQAEDSTIR